jgi:hypothetical protein
MNIPEILANEDGVHSVEVGENDVRGVLESQYNCGPSLCSVNIVTASGTDTSTCISNTFRLRFYSTGIPAPAAC